MQQLGFSLVGDYVVDIGHARADIEDAAPLLFSTTLDWMGSEVTGYLFGAESTSIDLGSQIGSNCMVSPKLSRSDS